MNGTAQKFGPVVELPPALRLSFLDGLTAEELIKKCDWFIETAEASFRRDRDLGLLHYYDGEGSWLERLVCLVPAPGAAVPSVDDGIPLGLALWIQRRRFAEASLPQPKLWRTS